MLCTDVINNCLHEYGSKVSGKIFVNYIKIVSNIFCPVGLKSRDINLFLEIVSIFVHDAIGIYLDIHTKCKINSNSHFSLEVIPPKL